MRLTRNYCKTKISGFSYHEPIWKYISSHPRNNAITVSSSTHRNQKHLLLQSNIAKKKVLWSLSDITYNMKLRWLDNCMCLRKWLNMQYDGNHLSSPTFFSIKIKTFMGTVLPTRQNCGKTNQGKWTLKHFLQGFYV